LDKTFVLEGLNCPNCAAKIEREAAELEGVCKAEINLIKQTLCINIADSYEGDILQNIADIVKKHEPDVNVTEETKVKTEQTVNAKMIVRLVTGALIYAAGILTDILAFAPQYFVMTLFIAAYIVLGGDIIFKAIKNIFRGQVFDENFLMSISSAGAFFIGECHEAVAVMLFYQVGEFFQDMAVNRSRKSIAALMDIRPDYATLIKDGKEQRVSPEKVCVGDKIIIKPGERVPLDGIVILGTSSVDTKALTGEAMPVDVQCGDCILSGSINRSGVIYAEVTKPFEESTAAKILDMVENAAAKKAPTESFVTSFARYYTPAVVIMALLLAVIPPLLLNCQWSEWVRRGLVFLVVSCPCALVISIPLAFFGGIGAASKKGILVKGGNYLEALSKVKTVVFDKTGTLTKGEFYVVDTKCATGFESGELIEYAAYAESYSAHPIAKSIVEAYGRQINPNLIDQYRETAGQGISVTVAGRQILAGNRRLMERHGISCDRVTAAQSRVYVAVDGRYAGCIIIGDKIKEDSKTAVRELKALGIEKTVMLTGDNEQSAKQVADELCIDEFYAQLLPDDKVKMLEKAEGEKRALSKIAFVGDGINDAPVLARADIGVAMGGVGSDAAIEAADVFIMTDEISKLAQGIKIARATRKIVVQNIVFALGVKGIFLLLGALGVAGMWEAVFADVGVAIIAVVNAVRVLKK